MIKLIIFLFVIATPVRPNVIELEITREVNARYRSNGDLKAYVEIIQSGYEKEVTDEYIRVYRERKVYSSA